MMRLNLTILAAGMGSRYGGLKQIDPVGPSGETILDYSIYDALRAGFNQVTFVIRRDIEKDFRAAIGQRYEGRVEVSYAFQELSMVPDGFTVPETRKKPWGTAHAVLAARDVVTSPFAVINADDFYGAESYEILSEFLQTVMDDAMAHYAMVGFILRNTLSEHGHVARGICESRNGQFLHGVTERTKILKRAPGAVYLDEDGTEHPLTGDEWVSMNMWGFTPSFFGHLQDRFAAFLADHGQEEKAEFFIPLAIDALMKQGKADVRILPSAAPWFGVTYREDKPSVVSAIRALVDAGDYPECLWP